MDEEQIKAEIEGQISKTIKANSYSIGNRAIQRQGLDVLMKEYRKIKLDEKRDLAGGISILNVIPGDE